MIYRNGVGVEESEAADLGALRFQSRPEAVAEQLRNAILTGGLKPGDRLVEQKLAAKFGIGQPTVREALKDLELQGFVRKTSKKHTHVTRLTGDDYRSLLEVRLALEPLAVSRAAQSLSPEMAEELEQCVRRMETAAAGFHLVDFHESDLQFHRTIWNVAGNEYLALALERVAFVLFAFVLVQRKDDTGVEFRGSARQHRQILDGLRSGDPEIAKHTFIESTTSFWREFHAIDVHIPDDRPR